MAGLIGPWEYCIAFCLYYYIYIDWATGPAMALAIIFYLLMTNTNQRIHDTTNTVYIFLSSYDYPVLLMANPISAVISYTNQMLTDFGRQATRSFLITPLTFLAASRRSVQPALIAVAYACTIGISLSS